MTELHPFTGRTILIAGAATGIGRATANYLAARGAQLSLGDLSASRIESVAKEVQESYPSSQCISYGLNVCDPTAVQEWVKETKKHFGSIDGSFNNAGIIPKSPRPLQDMELDDWNNVINVNLTGVFNCLKYELQDISNGGSIVNMASVAGSTVIAPNFSAYVASKHGVIGLTRSAALESAPRGIRINAVCPSFVETPMVRELEEIGLEIKEVPQLFSRYASADEVAALVAFLLGDESKFITKATYHIDGGFRG